MQPRRLGWKVDSFVLPGDSKSVKSGNFDLDPSTSTTSSISSTIATFLFFLALRVHFHTYLCGITCLCVVVGPYKRWPWCLRARTPGCHHRLSLSLLQTPSLTCARSANVKQSLVTFYWCSLNSNHQIISHTLSLPLSPLSFSLQHMRTYSHSLSKKSMHVKSDTLTHTHTAVLKSVQSYDLMKHIYWTHLNASWLYYITFCKMCVYLCCV